MVTMMRYPFEASVDELERDPEPFISAVFSSLESEFLLLPKGKGFVEYAAFEQGYEALKRATSGFSRLDPDAIEETVLATPIALVVARCILGFTPPEWAYAASQETELEISQGFVRSLDRRIRMNPLYPLRASALMKKRLRALIKTACCLLNEGAPDTAPDAIHRLDKADTSGGKASIKSLATLGVPYAMLLYERFLGRPFAAHRDSVSELIGDGLESAIEEALVRANVSYRKTKRAQRVARFDQAPDFVVPDEFRPQVVIEAKLTEDDGTARDKVTRIQHLCELSTADQAAGGPGFEVVACIGGRGFGVRREDMRKLLLATRGKVFTVNTLDRLVECTRLCEFQTMS